MEIIQYNNQELESENRYANEYQKLYSQIISGWNNVLDDEQFDLWTSVILDIYYTIFTSSLANNCDIPRLDDIIENVRDYNAKIIDEIANYDVIYGQYFLNDSLITYADRITATNDELHDRIFDNLFQSYKYDMFFLLPIFIYDVLYQYLELPFIRDYEFINGNSVRLYINDSQNILFPEWNKMLLGNLICDYDFESTDDVIAL